MKYLILLSFVFILLLGATERELILGPRWTAISVLEQVEVLYRDPETNILKKVVPDLIWKHNSSDLWKFTWKDGRQILIYEKYIENATQLKSGKFWRIK